GGRLDRAARALQLFAKDLRSLRVDQRVRVAVRGQLVAGRGNLADDLGVLFRDEAENEEGGLDVGAVEDLQQTPSDLYDAVVETAPFGVRNLEALIPVLEVDGERAGDVGHLH